MKSDTPNLMTPKQARRIEYSIICFCLLALFLIFQPFSKLLFGAGAIMVVVGGLAFNLIPQCHSGNSLSTLGKKALIVAIVFATIVILALGSARLYGIYFIG